MTRHLSEEQVVGYIYHTLTDAQRETFDRHLDGCGTCRANLAEQQLLQRQIHYAVRETLIHVQPSPRMQFDVAAVQVGGIRRLARFWNRSSPLLYGGLGIALLILLIIELPGLLGEKGALTGESRLPQVSSPDGINSPSAPILAIPTPYMEEGTVAANGTHLYYKIMGSGAPIVLIHPTGYEHISFLPHLEPLARDYRLIFYDQRATGRSEAEVMANEITVETFVEDLEGLRIALGLERLNLLGHSWGGLLAVHYAIQYPDHVNSLMLVGSLPPTRALDLETNRQVSSRSSAEAQQAVEDAYIKAIVDESPAALADYLRLAWQPLVFDESMLEQVALNMTEQTAANHLQVVQQLNESLGDYDLLAALSTIRVPTLVMHGAYDPIPIEAAEMIQEHITGSELAIMERSGRFPFVEEPGVFLREIRAFLANVPDS